jgi:CRISPR/Cas system type I-B associated protein Csh2 (Cas7 group RAMP superfamily)
MISDISKIYVQIDDTFKPITFNDKIIHNLKNVFINVYEEYHTEIAQKLLVLFRNPKTNTYIEYLNLIKQIYTFLKSLKQGDFIKINSSDGPYISESYELINSFDDYQIVEGKDHYAEFNIWWNDLQILIAKLDNIIQTHSN